MKNGKASLLPSAYGPILLVFKLNFVTINVNSHEKMGLIANGFIMYKLNLILMGLMKR